MGVQGPEASATFFRGLGFTVDFDLARQVAIARETVAKYAE
jgi:hypothetical protein